MILKPSTGPLDPGSKQQIGPGDTSALETAGASCGPGRVTCRCHNAQLGLGFRGTLPYIIIMCHIQYVENLRVYLSTHLSPSTYLSIYLSIYLPISLPSQI